MTEQEKYNTLKQILNDLGLSAEVNMEVSSDTDTEIFIRKGFGKMYSFRFYGRTDHLFYERWSEEYRNTILTLDGLKKALVILLS